MKAEEFQQRIKALIPGAEFAFSKVSVTGGGSDHMGPEFSIVHLRFNRFVSYQGATFGEVFDRLKEVVEKGRHSADMLQSELTTEYSEDVDNTEPQAVS